METQPQSLLMREFFNNIKSKQVVGVGIVDTRAVSQGDVFILITRLW